MGKKINPKAIGKWLSENIIIVMIFLASVFVSTQNKNFLSTNNIRNLLSNTAVRFIIACGVSGATQHVSGMSGSGYVVAINKDEDAPIFDVADVGIIGDAMQVLPVMIEEIRKRKAE